MKIIMNNYKYVYNSIEYDIHDIVVYNVYYTMSTVQCLLYNVYCTISTIQCIHGGMVTFRVRIA